MRARDSGQVTIVAPLTIQKVLSFFAPYAAPSSRVSVVFLKRDLSPSSPPVATLFPLSPPLPIPYLSELTVTTCVPFLNMGRVDGGRGGESIRVTAHADLVSKPAPVSRSALGSSKDVPF